MSSSIETRDGSGFLQIDADKDGADTHHGNEVGEEDKDGDDGVCGVSTHLYVRPVHSSQALDKEVVLRRIRQRKRVNKVRAALHSFLGMPGKKVATPPTNQNPAKKWIDDAFAAP